MALAESDAMVWPNCIALCVFFVCVAAVLVYGIRKDRL